MELLKSINSLKYENEIDLMQTVYATGFAYTPPRRETPRPIFEMGFTDPRSYLSRNRSAFVGSVYPILDNFISATKEDKFRIVTNNKIYIVENMDVLNDNENARCYTFIAKNIIEKEI